MPPFHEPKIDCHVHVFDPARFPYRPDTPYAPSGHEIATADQFAHVRHAYGVRHALLVGPNSGYDTDNSCMLDAIAQAPEALKGIAVVRNDASTSMLAELQRQGVVGIAFNPALLGVEFYRGTEALVARVAALGLFLQIQVIGNQLTDLLPLLSAPGLRVLVDHCGRPDPADGVSQPGFAALLAFGRTGRAHVKLSGYAKFSHEAFPHADAAPFVRALVDAFTPERCLWGSDWPFLRAPARIDYGTLLALAERLLPDAAERRTICWDTPRRLFGFGA